MADESLANARILVVDDLAPNVRLLEAILERAGYRQVVSTCDPREVIPLVEALNPDILLLDLHMPHLTGHELIGAIRSISACAYFPILVLTADVTVEAKRQALAGGASDFLSKPYDQVEVLLRIRNLLQIRTLQAELQHQNESLEETVRERTKELATAQIEVLERLAQAVEYHDDVTGRHTRRVGEVSGRVAAEMRLRHRDVELIRRAAPLHDLGKVGIPDAILRKPGPLTPKEFAVMKTHTSIGSALLSGGKSQVMRVAEEIALCHHEQWGGGGYPNGRAGAEIPISARIVALVDFHDALAHDRPYRAAWPAERIQELIDQKSGTHFDPDVVEAFRRALPAGGGLA